jgi:hypothetical protein
VNIQRVIRPAQPRTGSAGGLDELRLRHLAPDPFCARVRMFPDVDEDDVVAGGIWHDRDPATLLPRLVVPFRDVVAEQRLGHAGHRLS